MKKSKINYRGTNSLASEAGNVQPDTLKSSVSKPLMIHRAAPAMGTKTVDDCG